MTEESEIQVIPDQLRWSPIDIPQEPTDFTQGLITFCGTGHPTMRSGLATHMYVANQNMKNKAFYNSDGDFLIGVFSFLFEISNRFSTTTRYLGYPD